MADIDLEKYEVHEVAHAAGLHNDEAVNMETQWPRHGHRRHRPADEAQKHFPELAKLAELAHERLVEANSRYRFCIYEKDGGVFLDVVILDENGKVAELVQREITHQDFLDWLDRIEEEEGLIFDGRM